MVARRGDLPEQEGRMKSRTAQLRAWRKRRREMRDIGVCECGNPNPQQSPWGCLECQRIDRERRDAESTSAAVLRAVRRHGEPLSAPEIAASAGVTIEDCSARLSWLKRSGFVESKWEQGFGMVWWATERKRRAA